MWTENSYFKILNSNNLKNILGEFPSGPVVGTQCFHCHGWDSIPGRGLRSHKLHGVAENE